MIRSLIQLSAADPGFGGGGGGGTDGGCGWGGCGRWVPLPPQLGGMGERCKFPHRGLGRGPRSFAILLYSNHETR